MASTESEAATALSQQWTALTYVRSEAELFGLISDLKAEMRRHLVRRYLRKAIPLLASFLLLYAIFSNDSVSDTMFSYTRRLLVKMVFPIVNIPQLVKKADVPCLLPNPYFEKPPVSPEECEHCKGISRALVVPADLFTQQAFHEDFLKGETPVVVKNGAKGWMLENMTVQHLHDFYLTDELLKRTLACSLVSDQRISRNNNKLLLRMLLERKPGHWFALWEHCSLAQTKAFRPLVKRPPFLLPSVSLGGHDMHSWLVLGRDPKQPELAPLPFTGTFFFLGQLRGQTEVRLQSNRGCTACKALAFRLEPGDLLVMSEFYDLSVMPTGPAFSLAFGFAGDA